VRTKGLQGKIHKTARVFSNDPEHPQVIIGLKGKVWVPIYVNPRHVRLRGIMDEKIEKVIHLRGEKKEPLIVKLASVSIPNKVEVKLQETQKGRTYQLKVRNKVKGKATYRGQVKLTTNYPEKPEVVVKITGNIRGRLEVSPSILSFGRMSQERLEQLKNDSRVITRSITVRLNKGNDLKIRKVELEKSLFRVSTREIQRGQVVQVVVEPVLEKLRKGANKDRLKIYTNQKGREVLEVPITFELL